MIAIWKPRDLHLIVQGRTDTIEKLALQMLKEAVVISKSTRSCEVWSEDKSYGLQPQKSAFLSSTWGDSGAMTRFTQLPFVSRSLGKGQSQDPNSISMLFIAIH